MNRAARFVAILGLLVYGVFASQGVGQAQASNKWTVAGHLTQARSGAAAVLLTDGRVLITGGSDSTGIPQATAEIYDPATGTYAASTPMNVPRANHAAIVMKSGDVLVTGGLTVGGAYSDTAEIYSVSSKQWMLLPSSIGVGLAYQAMAQLSDGNILIAGGTSTTKVVGSIVLFNLTDQTFTPIGTLLTPRTNAVAAATPDGRILIAGGTDISGTVLASTEIFVYDKDTMTGSISSGPTMTFPRVGATATSTYDGVAIIGGNNGQKDLGSAEIFSQWTNTFKTVSGGTPRSHHFAALLPKNGSILAMGGTGGAAVDLLQPWANGKAGAFFAASESLVNQDGGFASPASLGSLLAAGGLGNYASASELYWFPTISTDKPDYAPGTPVEMTGTGFQPFETVTLHIHEWVNQATDDDPDVTTTADSLGNFTYEGYAPDAGDAGARYHLTAVGMSSGYQAQVIFTDATQTIRFTNAPLDQQLNTCGELTLSSTTNGSGYDVITLQDGSGFGGGGGTGKFYTSQANCTAQTNAVTSVAGAATVNLWYRDSAAGNPVLFAFTSDIFDCFNGGPCTSQQETITSAPTQIVFATQPGGGGPGVVWPQQPAVAVEDTNYNTVSSNSDPILLTLTTGSGTMTCAPNPATASSGMATFSGCSITGVTSSGTCYRITAKDQTLGFTAVSNCFYIENPASAGNSTVTANPNPAVDNGNNPPNGGSTITVTLKDSGGALLVGKLVTLAASGGNSTIAQLSVTTNASGVATFTVSDSTPEAVKYSATDVTDNVPITQTVTVTFAPGPVSNNNSSVNANPNQVSANGTSTSTITVLLRDSSRDVIAGETVTLTQGTGNSVITTVTGVTNASGVATFTVTDTHVENVIYTASYSGPDGSGTLISTDNVNFVALSTTLNLAVNPNSITFGTSPVVLSAGLSVDSTRAGLGGVGVSFYRGAAGSNTCNTSSTLLGTVTTDPTGTAIYNYGTTALPIGTYRVCAFSPAVTISNVNYAAASSGSQTLTVGQASTLVWSPTPPTTSTYDTTNTSFIITATSPSGTGHSPCNISYAVSGGGCSISGFSHTVTITSGGGLPPGSLTCTVTANLAACSQGFPAVNYGPATISQAVTLNLATPTTLVLTGAPTNAGDGATFTVGTTGGSGLDAQHPDNGAVTYSTSTPTVCTVSGNQVTMTATGGGQQCTISATKASDGNYKSVTSAPATVLSNGTAVVTITNLVQTFTGAPLPVTVTTAPPGLSLDVEYTGTGSTSYPQSSIPPTQVGTYSVTATVTNPGIVGTSTQTETINPVGASSFLTLALQSGTSNPSLYGTMAYFVLNVSSSNGSCPTGTVQLVVDSSPVGNTQPTQCSTAIVFSTATIEPGTHTVTAQYSGDSNHAAGTSNAINPFTVSADTTSVTLAATGTSLNVNQAVTFTATVVPNPTDPSANGLQGSVQFLDGTTPLGAPVPVVLGTTGYTAQYAIPTGPPTVLAAGSHSITAQYLPGTDTEFAGNSSAISVTVALNAPVITWATPANIVYGTPLNDVQLGSAVISATDPVTGSTVAGTFAFTPAAGTVLPASTTNLSATFTPADSTTYQPQTATVSITVTQATLTVTADNQTMVYGAPIPTLTYTFSGFVNGDVPSMVTGTASCTTTATSTSPVSGNPYTISCTQGSLATVPPDYNFTFVSAQLTVTTATPTLSLFCPELPYDNTPHSCIGSATGTDGVTQVAGTWAYSPSSGTAPGSYPTTGTFTSTDTSYVTGGTATGTLIIDFATSSITLSCPSSVPYTGAAQTPCTAAAVGGGGLNVPLTSTITYTNNTNAGTAQAMVTYNGDANHTGSSNSTTFAIAPVGITVAAGGYTGVYAGTTPPPISACMIGGQYTTGLTCSESPTTAGPDVGTGPVTVTLNYNGLNPNNYTVVSSTNGTWTITPATPTISVTCNPTSLPYNGSAQTPCSATVTGVGGVSLTPVSLTYSNNIDAGLATATASYASSLDYSAATSTGSFQITAVGVVVQGGSYSGTYDGSPHALTACTVTGTGGNTYTGNLSCTNNPLQEGPDVGSGQVPVTSTNLSGGPLADFVITYSPGSWSITKATPTVAVSCPASEVYNGQPWQPCTATATGANGVSLTPVSLNYTNNINVSTVTAPATANASYAATANYAAATGTGTFNITPAAVTATAGTYSGSYTGTTAPIPACQITGVPFATGLTCTNNPINAGPGLGSNVMVQPDVTGDTGNFTITPVNGTWTINPAGESITLGNLAQFYNNGNPVAAVTYSTSPTALLPVTLLYGTNGNPSNPTSLTPPSAVGNYAVSATINNADYVGTISGPSTLVISTANLNLTLALHSGTSEPSLYGSTVEYDLTLTGSPCPTGTIIWTLDGVAGSPVPVPGTCSSSVTFTTDTLLPGTHTLFATYSGDGTYAFGQSNTVTHAVSADTTTVSLTGPNSANVNQSVTFNAYVVPMATPGSGALVPTGTVQFYNNGTPIGSPVNVSNVGPGLYVASLSTSFAAQGSYTITATYVPSDGTEYPGSSGTLSGTVTVTKITPIITWSTPGSIVYGTPLSATQLNAAAANSAGDPIPGSFAYNPAAGTLVPAGTTNTLSATFTPTNTTVYSTITTTVNLVVTPAVPTLSLTCPVATYNGQPQQTCVGTATGVTGGATPTGTWTYSPTPTDFGTYTVTGTFTSTPGGDYQSGTATGTLTINKAVVTATAGSLLNAVYNGSAQSPSPCVITGAAIGVSTLSCTNSPASVGPGVGGPTTVTPIPAGPSQTDFTINLVNGSWNIIKATPTVSTLPVASALTFGQTLASSTLTGGAALLGSTSVPGAFHWTTPGTVPPPGTPSESVTFTPTDTADFNTVTLSVTVTVSKATPTVTTLPTASAITYGQTLASSTLTGGVASVAGTFAWTTPSTAPGAGTPSESVTFTPTNTTDYNTVTVSVTVTVRKATPTVSTLPTASALTYGQTLASSTLTGGSGSVPGGFSWATPGTVPPVGTDSETVTFTPTDTADYNTVTVSVTVTVSKATPTVSTLPTASALTFGQTLASSTLTGGTASVPGTFAWTTPATAPPLGTSSQSVTFTPSNTTNYNTVTVSVTVTVSKATPTVSTLPTASALTFGQALSSSTLTGGVASVGGTFAWTTPATIPPLGSSSQSVTFTPTNTTDYNTVTVSVSVTVNKATPTVSTLPTASALTFGQTLASSTLTGGTASVPGTFAWTTPGTTPPVGTSSQSVTFTPTNTTDYNTVTVSVTVTVSKATPTVTTLPTAGALTFGQTLASSTLTGGTASVAGTFSWTTPATVPPLGTSSQSVTFTPTNTTNYNTVTVSVTVTVSKATPTVSTLPVASALTFGQTLASSTLTGGTASVAGTFSWTTPATVPPVGTDSESVTFTPTNTTDYNTVTVSVSVTVSKATPTVTTLPVAGALTFGQTLASSTLTGGTASVPGTFAWTTPATVPPLGTSSQSVTFTPTNLTDYNLVTVSVSVTVSKATPTVSTLPVASAITYGQTLASSTLTGGVTSVPGTFAWTTPATVPPLGSSSQSVTFTPTNTTDYNTVTVSVSVTVSKATPTVTAWPTASALTFGQTLASSTLTGGTSSVPGTFAWTTPATAPPVGTSSQSVTFTPTDTTDYNSVTGTVTVSVSKATPTVSTLPVASAIAFGQTLASSTLTGGAASVPGTFAWTTPATVPPLGSSSQSVTFTPTDTTDYNTVTVSVSVTVNKATPTVTAWPTASALTFGQTLASSTLTGGTSSVPGTFSWTTPATAPPVGTSSQSVTFTPTDTTDYNTVTGTVTVSVSKATPTVSTLPTASALTFGQTLASSTLTGGTSSVPGTFSWTTPATAPPLGANSESVTFTPTDTTDYNSVTGTVTVTVSKATPTVTVWPTASAITFGQTLASSTLTGGTSSVPGTFSWTTPATAPPLGTSSQSVTFTPTDTTDYNTVTGTVTVTVNKGTATVTAWPTASVIAFGQTLASSTLTGGTASVSGSFAWTTPATAPPLGTSSQSVTFTPTDATDYNSVTGTVTVTVSKATPTVTVWPTASAITFGQTLASSTLTGGTSSVPGTFSWTTPATAPPLGANSESVTFTPTDTTDYNTVTGTVTVSVSKATATVTAWPTASAIAFGQTLASSTLTGGTSSVVGTFSWTTPTTAPGAGTPSESVTFTPTDTTDYNTVTGTVTVTVNKAAPTVTVWPTASAITYGQTLASSTLTGGTSSVAGTFSWTTPATIPGAGTSSQSVTFTPTDTTDYNTVTGTVTVSVSKATATVTTWPTASAITYGQTLASSTLTGGTSSVPGTFSWIAPATAPGAGTPSESVTFTPTNSTDYNTVTGTVTVTVNKAAPTVTIWPTAGAITSGQTLASSTLTGGTSSVAGTFTWTTPATVPPLGASSQNVTFTPTDTTDYNSVTGPVTVTANSKTAPTVTAWPTASAITYGQTLASSTLTGGTASVAGTFSWTAPATAPGAGTPSESLTFTPTDTTVYNTVAGTVTVTVNKATPTVTAWPTAGALTFGQTLASSTLTGGTPSVPGTFSWTTSATVPPLGSSSQSVTFTPTDTADYNTVAGTVAISVNKGTATVTTWPTASALTFGQTLASSTLTGGTSSVPGTFSWTTPATAPPLGTSSQSVTFTPTDATDYNTVTGTVTVTVSKAAPTVTVWPTASAITFGQTLASSTLTGGTASAAGTFSWTTPSTAPGAGTPSESVTFTPTDTTNYNTVTGSVTVTVNKAAPTVTVWPTAGAITYGQTLTSSTLTGGTSSVAGTFSWTTPATAPPLGTSSQSVTFTPTDTADYNTVTGTVTVTVSKATPTLSTLPVASAITSGQTLASSTLTGGTASVAGTFSWTTPGTVPPLGTSSQSVTFTPTDTADYNTVTGTATVTVNNKTAPTVTAWPTAGALTYGQTLASSTLTGGTASVAGTFTWTTPATAPGAGTPSESVTFTPTDTTLYNTVTGTVTVTVSKATPTLSTLPVASAITSGQTLASSTLTGGTASVAGTFSWTTPGTVPPLGPSSQSVIFTPTDTADYNTVTGTVTVTVNNKTTPTVTAWPTAGAITYGQTLASSALTGGTASVAGSFAWTTPATAPGAGTPSESVTFTPTDTADYNTVTGTVTVTVSKATPTLSTLPVASALTFGQTLASSTLTGGTASVAGTFSWTTPGTVPPLGPSSQSVTFTPTDTTDYNTVTGTATVTVNNKTAPTVTAWPTAGALTYGQTLASSTLTGGTASVAGTFTWTTPATAPGAGTPSESVTFTPTDTTLYNTVTGTVTVTVSKATPTLSTLPVASAITSGQTLASSTLTGGTASVAGTFSWTTPTTAPPLGPSPQSVIFTPTDTADYNTVTGTVTVTVNNKTTPTVTAWPTAGAITYGQTLASSALTGGTASVAGSFAWTTPATAPGAGTPSESVTFTPTDTADYNTVTGTVTVTVSKATPTLSTLPVASALTFGQTLASSTLTGGTASVAGTFSWTTPGTVPPLGPSSQSVTFTPTDTTDYNTVTGTATVTVNNKTAPTVTAWPTAGAITFGQTLASSTLTGGTASVAGTFTWTTPATAPGAGTPSESVTFTPTDTTLYNTVTGTVTVTVNKATPTLSTLPVASAITSGQTLASSTLTGGTASVAGTFSWTTPTTAPPLGPSPQSVTFTPTDTTDYNTVTGTATVTVNNKTAPTVTAWPTAGAITFGQTLASSTLTGGTASVAGTFTWTTPATAPGAGTPSESVTFTPTDTADYNTVTGTVTVTVSKATPTLSTLPVASALTFGQTLASSTLTGGTASVAGTFSWTTPTTAPPLGPSPQSVIFTPTDTADYNTVTGTVTVTVNNKTTPTVTAWPTAGALTYGQTLASSTLTGGTASVAGSFAWTTPATAPGAGTPSESVTFTPTDTADYNTVTGTVTVTVSKATPTLSTLPVASAITSGQTLASSTLTGGTASVAGTFSWTTPGTVPPLGPSSQSVTFTPTDTADYNTVTGTVTVTVNNKTTPTVTAWPTAGALTYGQTLASSTLTGGTASVAGSFAWTTPATAPGAGTPSESVTFTPTDTTLYNTVTGTVTVTVSKATPTLSTLPVASALTFGQTLASSTLTGGTASVAGTFSWTTPTTAPPLGPSPQSVIFTPTDTADYNTVTASVTVTVNNKTTPTVTAWPTAGALTYGQTLASSTLTGGTASVAGSFAWTTPATAPGAGTPSESVTFTPTDTADYNTVTGTVTVTVSKATPTLSTLPVASAITSGQTLASSTLTGGTASVAGTFSWTTPGTVPPLGPSSQSVTFTPTDTADYNTVTGTVTVTVNNKTAPTVTAWPTAGAITFGQTLASSTLTGGTASVVGTFSWTTPATVPSAGTPSESVTFTPTDTTLYNTVTGTVTVTVNKATPTLSTLPVASALTFGQTLASSTLTGGTASVAGTFSWTTPTTAPPLGPSPQSVIFTPTDTADYNTVTASVTVTVNNKTTPTVTAWPTAGALTYGQTLASSTLTGGTASVAGSFAWTTPATAPGAGTPSESVTFTPTDTADYNTVTGTVTVTVSKATPTLSTLPVASAITSGQTLASSTLTGGTASVAGTFSWTTPGTVPPLGPSSQSVTFTPTDTADYNTVTGTVTVTVNNKTAPTVTAWPTAGAITFGQTLASSTLTGGTASVVGTFSWTTPATVPSAGTPSESVTFTPTDTTLYNTVTGTVTVTVNKATPTLSTLPVASAITSGQTLASSTLTGGTASVAGTFSWTTPATVPPSGTSSQSVTFTPTDTADYNTVTGTVTVTVNNKTAPTVTAWPTAGAITFGQTLASSTLTGGTASVAGSFAWTTPATAPGAGTPSESVTFTPTDTTLYNTVTGTVTVTVNKATPTLSTLPVASALTFGQTLASSTLTGGTASVAGTFSWTTPTTAPPLGPSPQSVIFTPTDTADYNTVTGTVTVTVNNKTTPTVTAWPTAGALTYGQTLASSTLTGGTASVAGSFAWTTPATAPGAGTPSESVTFTPTDTTLYNTVTGTVTVTVSKATPTLSTLPVASAITSGQTLASSTLTGGTASVAGTFSWTTPTTAPPLGPSPQSVIFTPTDTADYNTVTGTVTVTVNNKTTPTVTAWPTAGAITYGQTLASSALTGGTASVAGSFAWTTPATAPGAGTPSESVTFTPTDTADYNTVTGTVTVTVSKATPTLSTLPVASALTFGQTLASSTLTGGTASVAGSFFWTTPSTAPGAGTPSETVTFTPTDTTDYNTVAGSVTVTVNKALLTVAANNASRVYGTANPSFTGSISGTVNGDTYSESYSTVATIGSNVGSYPIVPSVTGANLNDYAVAVQNGTLTITQAGTATSVNASSSSVTPGQSVTLTAQVTSATTGTPTGSVAFYDGTTLLGTVPLTAGTATLSTSSLAPGATNGLQAVYGGDNNFTTSSSSTSSVSVAPLDYTLAVSGASSLSVNRGSVATYQVTVAPLYGTYPGTVSFAANGLPTGASIAFNPSTIAIDAGKQTVTVTVQTPALAKLDFPSTGRKLAPLTFLALFLIPLIGAGRMRRQGRRLSKIASLLLLLVCTLAGAMVTGCGGAAFKATVQNYTIQVTTTSGNMQHSASVSLQLK